MTVIKKYNPATSQWEITIPDDVGSQGSTGAQGTQGRQGPQGFAGVQGNQGTQGNQGFQGTQGNQGAQGNQGVNLPTGGALGQVLVKNSASNYDASWASVGASNQVLLPDGAYLSGSGLVLANLSGNNASTPDSIPLRITGDIDIRCKVKMDSWTPSVINNLIAKWPGGAGQRAYRLQVETNGTISIWISSDGTAVEQRTSTAATGFSAGATKWVRSTVQMNDGSGNHIVNFYTSDDGISWTQLGGTIGVAGTTSIFAGTQLLEIGAFSGGGHNFSGTYYRAQILSGINGAVVFDADFSTQTANSLAFNATSGAGIKANGLVLNGIAGQYASTPDSAALDLSSSIEIIVKATLEKWSGTTSNQTLVCKGNAPANLAYQLQISTDGIPRMRITDDGYTWRTFPASVSTGLADGSTKWLRAVLTYNNPGYVVDYYIGDDGSIWTTLGTQATNAHNVAPIATNAELRIGSSDVSAEALKGMIQRAIVRNASTNTTVFDADFDAQAPETISFTESSSNAATVTLVNTNPAVTINTTRYTYGVPGATFSGINVYSMSANTDYYHPFFITSPISVDMFMFEVTTAPSSNATTYLAIYNADDSFQPIGTPVATVSQSVNASQTGVFRTLISPVTLQPGAYVMACNSSQNLTMRHLRGGMTTVNSIMSTLDVVLNVPRTAAAFTSTPTNWRNRLTTASGFFHHIFLRYRAA